jgi:hypothetical protein
MKSDIKGTWVWEGGPDATDSKQDPVAGSYEQGDKSFDFVRDGESLDRLSDYQLQRYGQGVEVTVSRDAEWRVCDIEVFPTCDSKLFLFISKVTLT